ncbi:MAG: hypothetical protein AAB421_00305 [Patescibacteria group bacterium]
MSLQKISKLLRFGVLTATAVVFGLFISIKADDQSRGSILLDFDTQTASADVPGGSAGGSAGGTAGTGTSDSGSSDGTAAGSDGDGSGGSGDSGSGDCGGGE